MRFPVSLLTAAVLVEAIIVVFVDRYHLEEDGNNSSQSTDGGSRDPHRSRAHEDVKPISKDIVGLLGISHVSFVWTVNDSPISGLSGGFESVSTMVVPRDHGPISG